MIIVAVSQFSINFVVISGQDFGLSQWSAPDASALSNGDVPQQSKIENPFLAFNLSFGFF